MADECASCVHAQAGLYRIGTSGASPSSCGTGVTSAHTGDAASNARDMSACLFLEGARRTLCKRNVLLKKAQAQALFRVEEEGSGQDVKETLRPFVL